ncbi:MAG: hypothetical protein KDC53_02885 [Saprospiraceae bacterium]|nr:hypothetical protein [Saprospiraceae bacterium]
MREKDRLEKFILDHRDAFDEERPSFKLWADIEKGMKKKNRQKILSWQWSIAASLLLVVGMFLGMLVYPRIYEYRQLQALNQSEEFDGMTGYFNGEIESLFVELKDDEQKTALKEELDVIDNQINKLKLDLIHAPKNSKELIFQAIIESYETKVNLLETAINRKKEVKKINNEIHNI